MLGFSGHLAVSEWTELCSCLSKPMTKPSVFIQAGNSSYHEMISRLKEVLTMKSLGIVCLFNSVFMFKN